jgi:hypothetical protein
VPPEDLERIKQRAVFDENEYKWAMITHSRANGSTSSSSNGLNNDHHSNTIAEENGEGEESGEMMMERLNLLSPQQSSSSTHNPQAHQMADSGLGRFGKRLKLKEVPMSKFIYFQQ